MVEVQLLSSLNIIGINSHYLSNFNPDVENSMGVDTLVFN
jgi:hypothetical protein